MKTVKTLVVASTVSLLALVGASAHAGGFLADTFIKPFNPDLARNLDQMNAQNGRPVEAAVAATADAFVPGAGTVLSAGWAIQNSGLLNSGGVPVPPPIIQPPPVFNQQRFMGNFCHTPVGRFGPGPVQAIGTPCFAGNFPGNVGL